MKTYFLLMPCLFQASMALLVPTSRAQSQATRLSASVDFSGTTTSTAFNRKEFIASAGIAATGIIFVPSEPAVARGRATLEKSFERYFPRVQAGGEFYSKDLRKLVEQSDWSGIKLALQEPPERQKGDLNKADAGVSERARLAGGFSNARVLVAADLLASAFSDNSVSVKTKKMQEATSNLRDIVAEMQKTARLALGEESMGGFFGIGAKKPDKAELAKQMRKLYVDGGNEWNKYVAAANDELALQFPRLSYVK